MSTLVYVRGQRRLQQRLPARHWFVVQAFPLEDICEALVRSWRDVVHLRLAAGAWHATQT